MKTTEGFMDLDFENMELYKQGGLLCPMVPMPMTDQLWWADCPDGSQYLIQWEKTEGRKSCHYNVYRLRELRVSNLRGLGLDYISEQIGTSEEFDLDV